MKVILFILLILLILIIFLIVYRYWKKKEQEEKETLLKKIDAIKKDYSRAFNSYIDKNKIDITTARKSVLESILNRSEWKDEDDRLKVVDKKNAEISQEYAKIRKEYPYGLKKWMQLNPNLCLIKTIVSNKTTIEEYEQLYAESLEYNQWEKEQAEFTQNCRDLIETGLLQSFGCYPYYIPFDKKNEDGKSIDGKYLVWQFFPKSYCLDDKLDYSDYEYIKNNIKDIEKFKRESLFFNEFVYEQINTFITKLSSEYDISVFFCYNNKEWDGNSLWNHYNPIFTELHKLCEVYNNPTIKPCDDINYKQHPILKNRHIVIIEMQTDNSHLKEVCKNIIEQNKDKHPLITYISLLKGYDTEEMQKLIDKKKKEKVAEEEKKRREQEEAERRKYELEKYKPCKDEIIKVLNDNKITYLYHFTSVDNLDSIKQNGGLYSWWSLKQKNIEVPFLGGEGFGQNLDMRYGLQDYVRLSFCDDHPMMYKHKQNGVDLMLLKIDIEVATWKDTLFSDMNATDNNHSHGGNLDDLKRVNFDAVKRNYVSRDDDDFKPHQAEVMVKTFIPIEYIKNIDSPLYLS